MYPRLEQSRGVIISDNPCPEYRLELLERGRLTLLGGASVAEVAIARTLRRTVSQRRRFALPNA